MHAYGCSRCDADFVRNSKRLDERDALRARVAELEAALRETLDVLEDAGWYGKADRIRKLLEVKP
jgi:hypothetical protein